MFTSTNYSTLLRNYVEDENFDIHYKSLTKNFANFFVKEGKFSHLQFAVFKDLKSNNHDLLLRVYKTYRLLCDL